MGGPSLPGWLRLLPLVLVILIDSIGYTLIIPVMSTMLLSDEPVMIAQADASVRYIVYGVAVGIYELMMLYMAPVLGELSDQVGRRRILLVCMMGVGVSFLMIGVAIELNIVLLLLLANGKLDRHRLVPPETAGGHQSLSRVGRTRHGLCPRPAGAGTVRLLTGPGAGCGTFPEDDPANGALQRDIDKHEFEVFDAATCGRTITTAACSSRPIRH